MTTVLQPRRVNTAFLPVSHRCEPTAFQPVHVMPSEDLKETKRDEYILEHHNKDSEASLDQDTEFGGTEARKKLERRLLLKLDARMSILVAIYLLNCVSSTLWMVFGVYSDTDSIQTDRNNAA